MSHTLLPLKTSKRNQYDSSGKESSHGKDVVTPKKEGELNDLTLSRYTEQTEESVEFQRFLNVLSLLLASPDGYISCLQGGGKISRSNPGIARQHLP